MKGNGKLLKQLRLSNGYTEQKVAAFLNVDQSLVAKIESDTRNISLSLLQQLLSLYGVEYSDFINGKVTKCFSYGYRSKDLANVNLAFISDINKIALNLKFMEDLDENGRDTN